MAERTPSPSAAADGASTGARHDLGWALGTLLRAYLEHASQAVMDLPGGPRAYQVMTLVARDAGQNQAAIAQRIGLDRTTMTYLIDGLEGARLIKRTPDPVDRRARHVSLTAKGTATLAKLAKRVEQVEHDLLSTVPAADAEHFRRTLEHTALQLAEPPDGSNPCQGAMPPAAC